MRNLVLIAVLGAAACGQGPDPQRDTAAPPTPATSATAATTRDAGPPSTMVVTERGIGPLRVGMSLREASAAAGTTLAAPQGRDPASCYYVAWRGAPAGVRVMVEASSIARIDVDSAGIATAAGMRVGDAEERVQQLYPGRVEVSPHKYIDGHYLTVTPESPADSAFRIVFEADKGRIVRYRAGRLPAVGYVEGCG
jgi:hypothetical protein